MLGNGRVEKKENIKERMGDKIRNRKGRRMTEIGEEMRVREIGEERRVREIGEERRVREIANNARESLSHLQQIIVSQRVLLLRGHSRLQLLQSLGEHRIHHYIR